MKLALSLALLLLVLALTGGILVVTYDVHQDLASVHVVLAQASATAGQLTLVVAKVNAAATTVDAAADEERKNWAATSKEAAATGRALRMLISRVDRSFVDHTLQHVNSQTLPLIDAQIIANGDQLAATLKKLGGTADGMTTLEGTLNARLDDPAIAELLGRLNATAANVETISANGAAMSGDMKLAVHRMAQPPTKWHQFIDAAWTTAKFGSLFVP